MPLIVANGIERCVTAVPQLPVVIPANKSTTVLPDISKSSAEYCGRSIQNVGAGICYYCIGGDCNPVNFSGIMGPASPVDANGFGQGGGLDVSNCPSLISVYSVAGTTIAVTLLKRNDSVQGSGGILTSII